MCVSLFFFFWISFTLSLCQSLGVPLLFSLFDFISLSSVLVTLCVSFSSFFVSSPFLRASWSKKLKGKSMTDVSIHYRDPEIAADFLGIYFKVIETRLWEEPGVLSLLSFSVPTHLIPPSPLPFSPLLHHSVLNTEMFCHRRCALESAWVPISTLPSTNWRPYK